MKSICEGFVRRILLSAIVVLFTLISFGATYYIAPNGNDANTGTISSPWFTLNKAWTVLKAGDTVYLRGGTYAFNTQQNLRGKNGTSDNLITISAYNGEVPILSKSSSYPAAYGIYFRGDYFHWFGITIAGYAQPNGNIDSHGMRVENSNYNTFENLNVYNNGIGMSIYTSTSDYHSTGNLVLNCDFHHNQDPYTTGDPYGNGDGLTVAWIRKTDDVNYIRGCRFYWNTDDGIDLYMNDGTVEIENCQAFYNGYVPDTFTSAGDGNGFKLGTSNDYRNDVKRILKNCVAVKNKRHGVDINDEYGIIKLYNCNAYLNGYSGIVLSTNNLVNYASNCISYANTNANGLSTNGIYTNNSWQNGLTLSTSDFKSLDTKLLLSGRQADGSLAVTDFLRLVSSSKLIDKGINVGIPYSGSAPDIGCYEFVSSSVASPTGYNVTGGGSFCIGGSGVSVGLSGSQTGVNYQLQLNGVNTGTAVAGTGSSISFGNKTVAGTYTVVATNPTTSATSNMVGNAIVTVNPLPTITFTSGVSSANVGSSNNVYTTQSGMTNYVWSVSSGGSITSGGSANTNTVSVTWNTSGTQYVTVNYSNTNGCSAIQSATYTVTVNSSPTGYNVTGGGSYCSGGASLPIGLSGSQTGVNYQLKLNGVNDGATIAGTGSSLSFGVKTTAGTYTVVATNPTTSATSNMNGTAIVTVNPLPTITFTSGVSSANVGSSNNVYTTQSGMTNYLWSVSSGGSITSGGSANTNTVSVTWNTSGTQYVTVNYSNTNGCSAIQSATYTVTVNSSPTGYNVTGGGSYCSGGAGLPIGLSGSQTGVNYQLKLNGVNDGATITGTGSALSFGVKTTAGTYTVVATNPTTSTTSNMNGTAIVSVNPLPTITFTSGVSSANAGVSGNTYTTQAGMTSYKWSVSTGGTITSGGTSTSNSIVVTWNSTGTQSVSVNYSNANGCSASVSTTYNVNVNPEVQTATVTLPTAYSITGGGSFCNGSSGVLVGLNNSQIGVNYQLILNGSKIGSVVAGTGSAISFGYETQAGTYTVVGTDAKTSASNNMIGSAIVSINPVYATTENVTINQGQNYQGWTSTGKYTRTLTSRLGCDSIVTTNLTVASIEPTTTTITHKIQLKKGSNLISSYLIPSNTDAGVVIKPLINLGTLVSLADEDNSLIQYNSGISSWTNDIGSFEKTEGYLIKVNANCELQITGTPVSVPMDIALQPGWNIISYPKTEQVNAMSVVQTLINQNKLVKVQDENGNSIENLKSYGGWKNNIGNFLPGKAYKVYVNAYTSLTIQSTYTKSALSQASSLLTEHFQPSYDGNGLNHMNINFVDVNLSEISAGDELAAFDGNICVGALKVTQEQIASGSLSLISSYKTSDQSNDGFVDDHSINLTLWKSATGKEISLTPEVVFGELKYAQNGSVAVRLSSSLTTGVSNLSSEIKVSVFPNPSNGQFTVRLSEMPDFNSRIDVLDVSGRIINSRQIENTTETFNLNNVPTGIYLVKTICGSSQILNKLIVTK